MRTTFTLFLSFVMLSTRLLAQEDFYSQNWAQVYKLEVRDLPESALKIADQIYTRAKREKNIPQVTKALIYQSKFIVSQPDAELLIIQKWKKEIKGESTVPLKISLRILSPICIGNIFARTVGSIITDHILVKYWTPMTFARGMPMPCFAKFTDTISFHFRRHQTCKR